MKLFLTLLVLGISIFCGHYLFVGQAVYGDGIGYYSHLHSWVIDHDWNYTNEYLHNYNPINNNKSDPDFADSIQIVGTNNRGQAENHYSPGMAFLLLPSYTLAHGLSIIFRLPANGYADIYQISAGIMAVFYTISGLFVLEKTIHQFVRTKEISRWIIMTMYLGTNLFYYGSFDVINSHFASFFLTSVFFYLLFYKSNNNFYNLVLTSLAGLLTSVRLQDGVVILIWFIYRFSKLKLKEYAFFLMAFIVSLFPLIYQWHQVFDNWWQHRYFLNFLNQNRQQVPISIFGSWFDKTRGLFAKSPIMLFAIGYLLFNIRKIKDYRIWFLVLFFALQTLIIILQRGWLAAAFGGRMYISSLVPLSVLLALCFQKIPIKATRLICAVAILLNMFSMGYFILFEKGTEGSTPGTELKTLQRLFNR